jgi:hypothetical protein
MCVKWELSILKDWYPAPKLYLISYPLPMSDLVILTTFAILDDSCMTMTLTHHHGALYPLLLLTFSKLQHSGNDI